MSPLDIHLSVTESKVDTSARFVRLVLALYSSQFGQVGMGLKPLANITGLSHTGVSDAINRLVAAGEIKVVEKGAGTRASVYQLHRPKKKQEKPVEETRQQLEKIVKSAVPEVVEATPITPPQKPEAAPQVQAPKKTEPNRITSDEVARVVKAAGIETSVEQPLYWRRSGHIADLRDLLDTFKTDVDGLCDMLAGIAPVGRVQRLTALKLKFPKRAR